MYSKKSLLLCSCLALENDGDSLVLPCGRLIFLAAISVGFRVSLFSVRTMLLGLWVIDEKCLALLRFVCFLLGKSRERRDFFQNTHIKRSFAHTGKR